MEFMFNYFRRLIRLSTNYQHRLFPAENFYIFHIRCEQYLINVAAAANRRHGGIGRGVVFEPLSHFFPIRL